MTNPIHLQTFHQQAMHAPVGSPQHSDVKMDPGLSGRMRATLSTLGSRPLSRTSQEQGGDSATIDLSTAQNEVIRPELLEFFKSLVEDGITEQVRDGVCILVRRLMLTQSQVFDLPAGDGGDVHTREGTSPSRRSIDIMS